MNLQTAILIIGNDTAAQQTIERLINTEPSWDGTTVLSDEEAIEKFHQYHFDVVLFNYGIGEEEEKKLRKIFTHQNPDIIIQYYDAEISPIQTKIREALDSQKAARKRNISFTDDPLRNAGLQINIQ